MNKFYSTLPHTALLDPETNECRHDNFNDSLISRLLLKLSFLFLSRKMKLPYSVHPCKDSKEFFSSEWKKSYPRDRPQKEQIEYALSCIKVSAEMSFTYAFLEKTSVRETLYLFNKFLGKNI